ncbi:MAG: 3D-(3,5/4)-trihydroxycyclohexane-1,2-dione acylhydrolase (decyclizing) [Candidatus Hinthialibacter antarcticus]|nr:3D-(3,5/4)-trihydroxycyclohexane-1,2-dione acylhydrolase (decyclizing) [Candidatus Hinthialibacter antarcticus]
MSQTRRLTMAQAMVKFLSNQYVERDGVENRFFEGIFGIFGHGMVAGLGLALEEYKDDLRYYQCRNEQGMVHTATAFAKQNRRLKTFICTSSIGPGATNMLTGAATATINRIPVLLLPGDIFAKRNVGPVLQQLESPHSQDMSVNDCFKPVSKYWDRINRPDQIITALPEAMRVLTSPAETGTVTIAIPQDVQTETFDYPEEFFRKRVYHIPRPRPEEPILKQAVQWIKESKRPMVVAGGGVLYSDACAELLAFCDAFGIPVGETQAGKGSLIWDQPMNLGALGVTGTSAANKIALEADLVINVGTRLSDFTTASKTQWQNPDVRFIGMNITSFDAYKHSALPLICDAKAGLEDLTSALKSEGVKPNATYVQEIGELISDWRKEEDRLFSLDAPFISQGEVIGAVTNFAGPNDVMVCAAGGLPGDLHKLWRTKSHKGYHLEYGYSCMGYEIAGGLGVKMANPDGEVYVMIGDGSYLMLCNEIVTSIQEGYKITLVFLDNHGFNCIRGLAKACGSHEFGNQFKFRDAQSGLLTGEDLPIDFAANAASLGANVIKANTKEEIIQALKKAKTFDKTTMIAIEVNPAIYVPGYNSWWDVAVPEVSGMESIQEARKNYEEMVKKEKYFL